MKKVTGIGGIFFKCKDLTKMKVWYKTHLGLDAGEYGATFEWAELPKTIPTGSTTWSLFAQDTKHFEPSLNVFMINYTVEDLESLVAELQKSGVMILDKIESYDYGKFVHISILEATKCNYGNQLKIKLLS